MSSWESPEVREAVEAAVARARQSGPSMPSDVSERLLARLAAEVTADPHATVATPVTAAAPDPGTTADVVVLADHRRRTLRRAMMAAASIVVVLAVGATLLTLGDGPAGHPDRTASGGVAEQQQSSGPDDPTVTISGNVLADTAALEDHVRTLVSGTPQANLAADAASGLGGATTGTTGTTGATGTSGSAASTTGPVAAAAPAPADASTTQRKAASAPALVSRLRGGLTACLRSLDPGHRALYVDEVRYAGSPALTVVFAGDNARTVSVYVVGPACGGTPPDGLLLFREVRIG